MRISENASSRRLVNKGKECLLMTHRTSSLKRFG